MITNSQKASYIIEVTPLTRISFQRDPFFYYAYFQKLPQGTLVEITLGQRKIKGIVLGSQKDFPRQGNLKIKNIKKVIEKNFLTKQQLELAQKVADYYLVSLGLIFKTKVPKIAQERRKLERTETATSKKIILNQNQKEIVQKIKQAIQLKKQNKFLLFGPASSGKTNLYASLIEKALKKNQQVLILAPELTIVAQEKERYQQFFPQEKIATLHGKVAKGSFYNQWKKIKKGEIKIILGTRQAVWMPFKNLKLIIVDEEQDPSFKQWDMSPRYDARQVAQKLSQIFKATLILGSATPRIEDYYLAQKREYYSLKLKGMVLKPHYEIVDMRKEYYNKGKKLKKISIFSHTLIDEIKYYLKHQQQIILLVNRQGMNAFSVCNQCGTLLRCPHCERALVYQKEGHYQCLHCNYRSSIFPVCSRCQGINFKNIGIGTQKVEKEIKEIFPQAQVARADSQTIKKSVFAFQELWQSFSQKKIDILVGTQMISKTWDIPQVGLVGVIDTDSLFDWPDFYTDERAFDLIAQLTGRVNRLQSKMQGKVILQTFHPDNKIIVWAAEGNYNEFYQQEIKNRKNLNYPPYSQLIKLIYQNKIPAKTQQETEKVYQLLKENNTSDSLRIIAPHDPLLPKIRNRWRKQIILQLKNKKRLPIKTEKIISTLKSGWIVDVDPISLT